MLMGTTNFFINFWLLCTKADLTTKENKIRKDFIEPRAQKRQNTKWRIFNFSNFAMLLKKPSHGMPRFRDSQESSNKIIK